MISWIAITRWNEQWNEGALVPERGSDWYQSEPFVCRYTKLRLLFVTENPQRSRVVHRVVNYYGMADSAVLIGSNGVGIILILYRTAGRQWLFHMHSSLGRVSLASWVPLSLSWEARIVAAVSLESLARPSIRHSPPWQFLQPGSVEIPIFISILPSSMTSPLLIVYWSVAIEHLQKKKRCYTKVYGKGYRTGKFSGDCLIHTIANARRMSEKTNECTSEQDIHHHKMKKKVTVSSTWNQTQGTWSISGVGLSWPPFIKSSCIFCCRSRRTILFW